MFKKKLSELCIIKSGDSNARDADDDGKYALFDRSRKIKKSKRFLFDCEALIIAGEGAEFLPRYYKGKFDLHQRAYAIHNFKPEINVQYLYYYLVHHKDYFSKVAVGATVKSLRQCHFDDLEVYFPSIQEQKLIVAKLDKAYSYIDRATTNSKKILINIKYLVGKILDNFLNKNECKNIYLNDVCSVERGSSPRPIKEFLTEKEGGINWIKIGDTKHSKKYITSTRQRITEEGAKKSRRVKKGDFVLTNSMSYGKPFIMAIDGCIHDGWFALKLKDNIDNDFFYYLLSSSKVQNQFKSLATGSVVKNISGELVKKTMLIIPSKNKQIEIRKKLTFISEYIHKINESTLLKITNYNKLKLSIFNSVININRKEI